LPTPNAEFRLIRVIRVRGAEFGGHFGVCLRALVFVADPHRDGRAERFALERAGKNLNAISLLARSYNLGLAGSAAIKVGLNVRFRQREARRAAVDHNADAATVRFTPGSDAEQVPKRICHAGSLGPEH